MEIYVKKIFITTFSFFWFSNMILSDSLILAVPQLQTQQLMTSPIMLHTEYKYYYILILYYIFNNKLYFYAHFIV